MENEWLYSYNNFIFNILNTIITEMCLSRRIMSDSYGYAVNLKPETFLFIYFKASPSLHMLWPVHSS
uniref:Uncharacterized protein n=1 Tax=Populus trichocarpa TaxID=3694 RepID=U5FKE8_POPTR